jgi:hypothetical protein
MPLKVETYALILPLLVSMPAIRAAGAATPTSSFSVSATVQAPCDVSVLTSRLGANSLAMANPESIVAINCTFNTPYLIAVCPGWRSGDSVYFHSGINSHPALPPVSQSPDNSWHLDSRRTSSNESANQHNGFAHEFTGEISTAPTRITARDHDADVIAVTITY